MSRYTVPRASVDGKLAGQSIHKSALRTHRTPKALLEDEKLPER